MAFYGLFNSGKIFEARVSEGEIVEDNFEFDFKENFGKVLFLNPDIREEQRDEEGKITQTYRKRVHFYSELTGDDHYLRVSNDFDLTKFGFREEFVVTGVASAMPIEELIKTGSGQFERKTYERHFVISVNGIFKAGQSKPKPEQDKNESGK